MPSATHDEEAKVRDDEVARLHPNSERKHLRATLPARFVLRSVEREENDRELKLLGESYVTAVVADGNVEFYAGSDPVWHAGTIATSTVVGVETSHEFDYTPPGIFPTLRLTLSDKDSSTVDMDLEVFTFDGTDLTQSKEIDGDIAWWKAATSS